MDVSLVRTVVNKIGESLPHVALSSSSSVHHESKLRQYTQTLLEVASLPHTDIDKAMESLMSLMIQISKMSKNKLETQTRVIHSNFILVEIISLLLDNCLPMEQRELKVPNLSKITFNIESNFSKEQMLKEEEEVDDDTDYLVDSSSFDPILMEQQQHQALSPTRNALPKSALSAPSISINQDGSNDNHNHAATSFKQISNSSGEKSNSSKISSSPSNSSTRSTFRISHNYLKKRTSKRHIKGGMNSQSGASGNYSSSSHPMSSFLSTTDQSLKKLNDTCARELLRLMIQLVNQYKPIASDYTSNMIEFYSDQIRHYAKNVIFKISLCNFHLTYNVLVAILTEGVDVGAVRALTCINLYQIQLSELLKLICNNLKTFAKNWTVTSLAEFFSIVRHMVWNWIIMYRAEFEYLHCNNQTLAGSFQLFEALISLAKKKELKPSVWPLMMSLLLLSPAEIEVASKNVSGKSNDMQTAFLRETSKIFVEFRVAKDKQLFQASVRCVVDLIFASQLLVNLNSNAPIKTFAASLSSKLLGFTYDQSCECIDPNTISQVMKLNCNIDLEKASRSPQRNAFYRAILVTLIEGKNFQLIMEMVKKCSTPLGMLFNEMANYLINGVKVIEDPSKTLRRMTQSVSSSQKSSNQSIEELLNTIVRIFYVNPAAFFVLDSSTPNDSTQKRFDNVIRIYVETDSELLRHNCFRLIRKLFLLENIPYWTNEKDRVESFTELFTQILFRLSSSLLAHHTETKTQRSILIMIRTLTYRAKKFYADYRYQLDEEIRNNPERLNTLQLLSSYLLLCLCSIEKEIWIAATRALRNICDIHDIFQIYHFKHLNYDWYRRLSDVDIDAGEMNTERRYQIQILRNLETQTDSILTIFKEVYKLWNNLLKTSERDLLTNYTCLLCALAGCLLSETSAQGGHHKFIPKLVEGITSPDRSIHRMITVAICNNFTPTLYDKLVSQMKERAEQIVGVIGQLQYCSTGNLFVENATQIIQFLLDNGTYNDIALVTEMDSLVLILVSYCSITPFIVETMQQRCKLCYVIESLMNKIQFIHTTDEKGLRRKLLHNLSEWTSEFAQKATKLDPDAEVFLYDLDLVVLKAMPSVLEKLKLEDDTDDFFKYLSFLNRFLVKFSTQIHQKELVVTSLTYLLQNNTSIALRYYINMCFNSDQTCKPSYLLILRDIVNSGLLNKQTSEQHEQEEEQELESIEDRYTPMMKLLFNSYEHRVIFSLLDTCKTSQKDNLCDAVIVLFQHQNPTDLVKLFKTSIEKEVESTSKPESLFRANSTASKLMTKYCVRSAKEYLKATIGEQLKNLSKNPKNYELEEEKAKKLGEDREKNIEHVKQVLVSFIDSIVNSVKAVPLVFRKYCKYLFDTVGKKFKKKETNVQHFDYKHIAVGGFIFLRLLCPAIISPHLYNLLDQPLSQEAVRASIILTKVLQNLANGISQAPKEPMMLPFKEFIEQNLTKIKDFYECLASDNELPEMNLHDDEMLPTNEEVQESQVALHTYMFTSLQIMKPQLENLLRRKETNLGNSLATGETEVVNAYDELSNILQRLGNPPEEQKKRSRTMLGSLKGDDFASLLMSEYMKKMSKVNGIEERIEEIEKLKMFFANGSTTTSKQALYFIASKFRNEEAMIYFIIQKLQTVWMKHYALIIDCTDLNTTDEVQISTFLKLNRLLPRGAKRNLKEIYFYNPSLLLHNFLKRYGNVIKVQKKKLHFCIGINELSKFVEGASSALPESTLNHETELVSTFKNVQHIGNVAVVTKDAIIKLFKNSLQVIISNQSIFGIETNLTMFIPLSSIISVSDKKSLAIFGKSDLKIKYYMNGLVTKLYIRTAAKDQITLSIKSAVTRRIQAGELEQMKQHSALVSKSSEYLGQLLNTALLGCSDNVSTNRIASYKLLCAVIKRFNLHTRQLESTHIYALPRNTRDFVMDISEEIAKNKPSLTLEILNASLKSIENIPEEFVERCLEYCNPWFTNLFDVKIEQDESDQESRTMLLEIIQTLVHQTNKYSEKFSHYMKIWTLLSKSLTLCKFCLEVLISYGLQLYTVEDTKGDEKTNMQRTIGDILVCLAKHQPSEVSTCIIAKTLQFIETIGYKIDFSDYVWRNIICLVQYLLCITFQNRICVEENLPDLLFIIILLCGIGNSAFRCTVYGLCLNILHLLNIEHWAVASNNMQSSAISTSTIHVHNSTSNDSVGAISQSNRQSNRQSQDLHGQHTPHILTFFTSRKCLGIFSGKKYDNQYDIMNLERIIPSNSPHPETRIFKIAMVIEYLKRAVEILPNGPQLINNWTQVIEKRMKTFNGILYSRLLCCYSILLSEGSAKQMIQHCYSLIGKLANKDFDDDNLAISTLLSIHYMINKLNFSKGENTNLLHQIFMICIIMSPCANLHLFLILVKLLTSVTNMMLEYKQFSAYSSYSDYVNKYWRNSQYKEHLETFEKESGLSLKEHFSFVIAVLFMRGLSSKNSRFDTLALHKQMLNVGNKLGFPTYSLLGFITSLMPFEDQYQSTLYCDQVFCSEVFRHSSLSKSNVPAFLFHKLLLIIMPELLEEEKKIAIYSIIIYAFEKMPDTFLDIFIQSNSIRDISLALAASHNSDKVIEWSVDLFKLIVERSGNHTLKAESVEENADESAQYYRKCGFPGFKEYVSFSKCKPSKKFTSQITSFVEAMLKGGLP